MKTGFFKKKEQLRKIIRYEEQFQKINDVNCI